MVKALKGGMRELAFEAQRAPFIVINREIFAVIRLVEELIWSSSIVLRSVRVNTLGPLMPHIFLRTICSFVSIHVKHVICHCLLERRKIIFFLKIWRNKEGHCFVFLLRICRNKRRRIDAVFFKVNLCY